MFYLYALSRITFDLIIMLRRFFDAVVIVMIMLSYSYYNINTVDIFEAQCVNNYHIIPTLFQYRIPICAVCLCM